MARLHSKKKGKSGTKRPKSGTAPEWTALGAPELKETILKMSREGIPPSKIGLLLRDQYGVPNLRASLGMTVKEFLVKEKVASEYPEDLLNLIRKAVRMTGHIKASKNDTHNKVKLLHVESKINRLVKYYSDRGELPSGWKYDREKAALLVK